MVTIFKRKVDFAEGLLLLWVPIGYLDLSRLKDTVWTVQTVPLFQPGTLIVLGTLIVTANCPGPGTLIVIDTSLNSLGP